MNAVEVSLRKTILELQNLSSVAHFSLGGGTNLALRYGHRISVDIDFISPDIVGKSGFEKIIAEVQNHYGKEYVKAILINEDLGEQFMFLRMFLTVNEEIIKVEFLQNMKCLFAPEIIDDFRLIHKNDIGLFKLMSATNRFAKKDIYDLDFITDEIPLVTLFRQLSEKRNTFHLPEHQSLFDLDIEKDVLEYPELLLEFDEPKKSRSGRPSHSHDRIDIIEAGKTWTEARLSWRMKVRRLFSDLGKDFPKPEGKSI